MIINEPRIRRAKKIRAKIAVLGAHRLSVHRSSQHIYAQIIDPRTGEVLAAASSLDKEFKEELAKTTTEATTKTSKSAIVGKLIARRAKSKGFTVVAFDRGGYKYHGRVKALADAAREEGMEF